MMKQNSFFLLLIVWLTMYETSAQVSFENEILSDTTKVPTKMSSFLMYDLDGDGDLDMLFASEENLNIVWFENLDGQVQYSEQKIIGALADVASSLQVGDVDGDGDNDVICVTYGNNRKIKFFENVDGNENFSSGQDILTSISGLYRAYLEDVDNDNDLDIIGISSNYDRKLFWMENADGQGNFAPRQVISSVISDTRIHNADIDGDGDIDILTISNYSLRLHENLDGQGTFSSSSQALATQIEDGVLIRTADIDGDGDLDIITSTEDDHKVSWFENLNGQTTFGPKQTIGTTGYLFADVAIGDLDGDGDLDVAAVSWVDKEVFWYENTDGQGTFGLGNLINLDGAFPGYVAIIDTDNDTDLDILTVGYTLDEKVSWYENTNGQGVFGSENVILAGTRGVGNLHTDDLDNDGDVEILFSSFYGDKVAWFENDNNTGNYAPQQIITTDADNAGDITTADIDGDGDLDVLSSSLLDNKIAWYENVDGQGAFGPQLIISTMISQPTFVTVADFDNDGDMDVLAESRSSNDNKIIWFENVDGLGTFTTEHIITTSTSSHGDLQAVDIDGDGDQDIITTRSANGTAVWFENTDGQGAFAAAQNAGNFAESGTNMSLADIDNDGDIDFVMALFATDNVVLYKNLDGQGTFGERQIIATTLNGVNNVRLEDLDNDGDKDLVVCTLLAGRVSWFENTNGQGTFGPQQIIASGIGDAFDINVADLDGDGDLDILSAAGQKSKITIHRNTLITPLSVDEFDTNTDSVTVYPNPVQKELYFNTNALVEKVILYDIAGNQIQSYQKTATNSLQNIDVSHLKTRLYIVKIQTTKGLETHKILKQ